MAAVLLAHETTERRFEVFNVATGDYITVARDRRHRRRVCSGWIRATVTYEYTGGDRGWKGDVPIVRLNTERIQALGWQCRRSSARGAAGARCAQ